MNSEKVGMLDKLLFWALVIIGVANLASGFIEGDISNLLIGMACMLVASNSYSRQHKSDASGAAPTQ
jgi:hypothetical protein